MDEKQEVMKAEGNSPAEMIKIAVQGGADLDKLEKLLTLQERWETNEAKKAYHKAMADFKANPPKINKDKKVAYSTQKGNVNYSFASLAHITESLTKELSNHGLSASWRTQQNGKVVVTCRITHVQGHYEETTLSADADISGAKNPIQAIGSTISYLQRYSLLSILGLATFDMDDDTQSIGVEYISEEQQGHIIDKMVELGLEGKEKKFFAFLGVESLDKLPAKDYNKAITTLEAKKGQSNANN